MSARRVIQLVASSIILGAGAALLLDSRLGADGFTTLIHGLRIWSGWPYWIVNILGSAVFIAVAWTRRIRPGLGTIVSVVAIGITVSLLESHLPGPTSPTGRGIELALAFVLLCIGVAGYLASHLGAGPVEAVALAFDPPIPFRWIYSGVQIGGAAGGWLLGAEAGVGTVVVVVAIGPAVDLVSRVVFRTAPSV